MLRVKHGSPRETAQQFFDLCRRQVRAAGLDPDQTYFIYPIGGFGEFTMVCSLLSDLRPRAKVALFLPESKTDFHRLFPHSADFVVFYPPHYSPCLTELYYQGGCLPGYPLVAFTDWIGDGRFNIELVTKEGRLTLKEGYAFMLGLPLTSPGLPATVPEGAPPAGLEHPGKRILVIPHANSHKGFEPALWDELARRCQAAGYEVVFEITNYRHAPPAGVATLSVRPLALLQSLGAFAGVVALRSGLTDLIGAVPAAQRGKMAVLYHLTEAPPAPEQRHSHSAGIARSGLALTRIYGDTESLGDFEIDGDTLDLAALTPVLSFLLGTDAA